MRLYGPAQPTTSDAVIYTATQAVKITHVHFCNTTGTAATIRIDMNSTAASSRLIPDYELAGGGVALWEGSLTLEAGETLRAKQGTSGAITVTIEGERA